MTFEADNYFEAVASVTDWARNRQRSLPEFFGPVGSFRVYRKTFQRVQPDGYLPGDSACCYEWKIDGGYPLPPRENLNAGNTKMPPFVLL
jgi:hypothetical protein